jgi:NADH-quinone oxidoreductase subunit G
MDVCPVGAITTRDYRFKSRPWDNPQAVDTICTLCSKGCNTTAWIKAKPEWAKGARLVRNTPRFNPDVNGYWMCDIGRFDYHWIEGDRRLQKPLIRAASGALQPTDWADALTKLRERIAAAATGERLRFLISAHASIEEMFLVRRLAESLRAGPVAVSWRRREKVQPARTVFPVPPVDAPNVAGARDLGLLPASTNPATGHADVSALRDAVERGEVAALYVIDPGPDGSIGDLGWILDARTAGRLPLLVVQGVLMTDVASAADIVLPGASFVEKEASYANDTGRVQPASRVMTPPGEAMDDWQILVNVGTMLRARLQYASAAEVRADVAAGLAANPAYTDLARVAFARPVAARNWLQASNPSERWKWDFMFQDLPPVKFEGQPVIPLRQVD